MENQQVEKLRKDLKIVLERYDKDLKKYKISARPAIFFKGRKRANRFQRFLLWMLMKTGAYLDIQFKRAK